MDWKAMAQMDPSVIDAMTKSKESIILVEPIALDELYSLMDQSRPLFPGDFKLKKGMFGSSIVFSRYMDIGVEIITKGNTVVIKRTQASKSVSSNNRMSIDKIADFTQTTQSVVHNLETGKLSEGFMGGANYFKGICAALRELLQS